MDPVIAPVVRGKSGLPGGPRDFSPFTLLVLGVLFLAGSAWGDDTPPAAPPPLGPVETVALVTLAAVLAIGAGVCILMAQGRYTNRRIDALARAVDELSRRLAPSGGAPPLPPAPPVKPRAPLPPPPASSRRPPSGTSSAPNPAGRGEPSEADLDEAIGRKIESPPNASEPTTYAAPLSPRTRGEP
jgi:hypothetical protein